MSTSESQWKTPCVFTHETEPTHRSRKVRRGVSKFGKLADLVALESDPTAIDPFGIKDITVARTILGGRTIYEA